MDELSVQVIAGLVVATAVGLASAALAKIRRQRGRNNPVDVTVVPIVGDCWSLALAGGLPAGADTLEVSNARGRDVYKWLVEKGAVDHGETQFRLTVRSLAPSTVIVREIRAKVERAEPLDGTLIYHPTAGANCATLLAFDLDESDPEAWEFAEDGGRERVGASPYFHTHNVSLAPGEVHDFIIAGNVSASLVEWTLIVTLEIDGYAQELEILGPYGPFRTSGTPAGGFHSTLDWAWWEGGRFQPAETWNG